MGGCIWRNHLPFASQPSVWKSSTNLHVRSGVCNTLRKSHPNQMLKPNTRYRLTKNENLARKLHTLVYIWKLMLKVHEVKYALKEFVKAIYLLPPPISR